MAQETPVARAKMTKREAVRWIQREAAMELRNRVAEPPDNSRIEGAPDPVLVEKLWDEVVSRLADQIDPDRRKSKSR